MNDYSVIVVGAGAGGLVVAIGLAKAGKKVLLVEKGHWGGDCTNFGCVPSKSLIASAERAHAAGHLEGKGRHEMVRVRSIVQSIRSHEDPDALAKHGVDTLTGVARFRDPHILQIETDTGDIHLVKGRRIVLATGSTPLIPNLPNLKDTPFLTNETVFELPEVPDSMIVLGGGPIGCELAQAFSRLGTKVSLVHRREQLLKKEEPLASQVIAGSFEKEGMDLFLGYQSESVSYEDGTFQLSVRKQVPKVLKANELLVAVGRRPNLEALNLDVAGVRYSETGIETDRYGRTSQKHIYAIGDVTGGPAFTHAAENRGRSVLVSLLLPWNQKLDLRQPVPRVTYTDPEIASIGMTDAEAKAQLGEKKVKTYTLSMEEVDRAITAGRTEGFIRVVTKKWSSQILGATIVAPRAGEMLMELSLAMWARIPLKKLAKLIHPYPIYNQGIRKVADLWLTQTLLPMLRKKK